MTLIVHPVVNMSFNLLFLHKMLYILILFLSVKYILDIPPIQFVFQITQKFLRGSLMMAGCCQNM
jgi:hypothetical protein